MVARIRAGSLTTDSLSATGLRRLTSASVAGSVTVQPWNSRSPSFLFENTAGQWSRSVSGVDRNKDQCHDRPPWLAVAPTCMTALRASPRHPPAVKVHLPGFRGRIDRMLGRSPGECRKGQHAPTWRKAADDQLAAYTDVPADQKHQAVEPVAVCISGSLTPGSKDDAEAPKATGRAGAVSRAGQG
jgi:hypothetical protein